MKDGTKYCLFVTPIWVALTPLAWSSTFGFIVAMVAYVMFCVAARTLFRSK